MTIYKISIIVLNLVILSNLSYADSNLTKEKEDKLDELLSIIRKAPTPLPRITQLKIEERVVTIYPDDRATIEDINKKINYIEKQSKRREAKIKNFEEELKTYQSKIETFDD